MFRVTTLVAALVLLPCCVSAVEITGLPETQFESPTYVMVLWETDVPSYSLVLYGIEGQYVHEFYDPTFVTSHVAVVPLYDPGEPYDFMVSSCDYLTPPGVSYTWYANCLELADIQFPNEEIVSEEVRIKAVTAYPTIQVYMTSFAVMPDGGPMMPIGDDLNGDDIHYNTFQPGPTGDGWSGYWNSFGFPDGGYTLIATMHTYLGPITATTHVWLDNTPPIPSLDQPAFGGWNCGPVSVVASGATDSNVCVFSKKSAPESVSFPTGSGFIQGNFNYPGRPGNMMCHPTAQAMILWTNPKVRAQYTNDSRNKDHTEAEAKNLLVFDLARNKGSDSTGTDEGGAREGSNGVTRYISGKQKGFDWRYDDIRGPITVKKLKKASTQPEGRVKGVGLHLHPASNPSACGHAVVLKNLNDKQKKDDKGKPYNEMTYTDPADGQDHTVRVSPDGKFTNPRTGQQVVMASGFRYTGSDPAGTPLVGAPGDEWEIIGVDTDPTDGWSITWDAGAEAPGLYFLKAETTQANGMSGWDMTEVVACVEGTVGEVKKFPDGTPVCAHNASVTHVSSGMFWIESTNRSAGIAAAGEYAPVVRDDALSVVEGFIVTRGMERVIEVFGVQPMSVQMPIAPLAMPNRSVVGGDFYYDAATGAGQMGGPGASGLNNVGMLVRTFGRCLGTVTGPDGTVYSIIDDGSAGGLWPNQGVLVSRVKLVPVGVYVAATGVCGLETWPDGTVRAIVRARDANDVQVMTLP